MRSGRLEWAAEPSSRCRRLLALQKEAKEEVSLQKIYPMKEGEGVEEVFKRMKEDEELEQEGSSVTPEMMQAARAELESL